MFEPRESCLEDGSICSGGERFEEGYLGGRVYLDTGGVELKGGGVSLDIRLSEVGGVLFVAG